MAEVSQKVGTGVYKLCPFKTNRAFLITSRSRVRCVFGACFSLRTIEKNSDEAHNKGKQMRRTLCTLFLRLCEKPARCPAASIISRSNSSNNFLLHTSKTAYYDILQVSPNATQAQIKTAYYRQSFRYHPDRNAGSDDAVRRFSEISEAYTVLGSVSLRRKYDRGVLSLADVQSAGRPSRKDTAHPPSPEQQQQRRSFRIVRNAEGKSMFDFDAFYQAHYGEQLEREQSMRRWRERRQQAQQEDLRKWKLEKGAEMAVGALFLLGVVLLFSLKS